MLEIYKKGYWDVLRGDEIQRQDVAEELFDTAVNCGPGYAIAFLQRTLNQLNNRQTLYPDLKRDGLLWPQTVKILNLALSISVGTRLCEAMLILLNCQQGCRYMDITDANEGWESFIKGVTRRVRLNGT